MQNDSRSHGLWERTAPPAPDADVLDTDIAADVAVVGAGYTGLSTALHLAEDGTDVAVLEAVDFGFGGAGRNVGLVNAGMWVMPEELPRALGPVHGERLLALLGDAPDLVFSLIGKHGIDCEAVRSGTLHCAVGRKGFAEIETRAAQWAKRGAPVRLLDGEEAAAKIGSRRYAGALLDERAGTIQPLAYVRGLARVAQAAGARLFVRSAVTEATRADGRWVLRTASGAVTADRVVIATDAYTGGLWPEIRAEQVALPYFQFATRPLDERHRAAILPERQGAWDTKNVLTSFRLDAEGRLIVGSVGALRNTGHAVHRAWAERTLRRIFPELGPVSFEAEWYGRIGMTADHLPRFHVLAPGVVSVSGYNGRGIAPGTVFGRVLADHLLGRLSEADLPLPVTAPEPAALRPVKEVGYEVGAQLVHLGEARF